MLGKRLGVGEIRGMAICAMRALMVRELVNMMRGEVWGKAGEDFGLKLHV